MKGEGDVEKQEWEKLGGGKKRLKQMGEEETEIRADKAGRGGK